MPSCIQQEGELSRYHLSLRQMPPLTALTGLPVLCYTQTLRTAAQGGNSHTALLPISTTHRLSERSGQGYWSPVNAFTVFIKGGYRIRPYIYLIISQKISDVKHKSFGLFPAEAGVCDGLAVAALVNLLSAVLDIALDHETLYHALDLIGVAHGV